MYKHDNTEYSTSIAKNSLSITKVIMQSINLTYIKLAILKPDDEYNTILSYYLRYFKDTRVL